MLVYRVTNKINGKVYIGMTSRTLEQRWKSHCSASKNGSRFRFHAAIRKYGEKAFIPEVLFDDLNIDECRTIEEQTISEYNAMSNGYNAKPGGCGGWIVPDEHYDEWLTKITLAVTRENNPKWSGYSDDFILDNCVLLFKEYDDPKEFTYKGILDKLRSKFDGIPKHFSKNRFKDYQNSFKYGLSSKLGIPVEELDKLSNSKSENHRKSLSNVNVGNSWYSNDNFMISKQSKIHPGDGWYRGRKYGNKN